MWGQRAAARSGNSSAETIRLARLGRWKGRRGFLRRPRLRIRPYCSLPGFGSLDRQAAASSCRSAASYMKQALCTSPGHAVPVSGRGESGSSTSACCTGRHSRHLRPARVAPHSARLLQRPEAGVAHWPDRPCFAAAGQVPSCTEQRSRDTASGAKLPPKDSALAGVLPGIFLLEDGAPCSARNPDDKAGSAPRPSSTFDAQPGGPSIVAGSGARQGGLLRSVLVDGLSLASRRCAWLQDGATQPSQRHRFVVLETRRKSGGLTDRAPRRIDTRPISCLRRARRPQA